MASFVLQSDAVRSFLLDRTLQRMLILPCQLHDLGHFRLSNLVSVNAAHSDASAMNVQHDTRGFLTRLLKKSFEDMNDKLHGRVVVVQHQHLVHRRLAGFGPRPDDDTRVGTVVVAIATTPVAVAHRSSASTLPRHPAELGAPVDPAKPSVPASASAGARTISEASGRLKEH